MTGRTFLDTNVLVYAIDDADSTKKEDRPDSSDRNSQRRPVCTSPQRVLRHHHRCPEARRSAPEIATQLVHRLARLPCVAIDAHLVQLALDAGQRWRLSHWDASVIEAARQAGCARVVSEDLAAGANYDGLTIKNPF